MPITHLFRDDRGCHLQASNDPTDRPLPTDPPPTDLFRLTPHRTTSSDRPLPIPAERPNHMAQSPVPSVPIQHASGHGRSLFLSPVHALRQPPCPDVSLNRILKELGNKWSQDLGISRDGGGGGGLRLPVRRSENVLRRVKVFMCVYMYLILN